MSTFGFGDAEPNYGGVFASTTNAVPAYANESSGYIDPVKHAEDFGYILYQAQRDLERVRTRLDSLPLEQASINPDMAMDLHLALKDVVARAEADLRIKAEVVLRSVDDARTAAITSASGGLGMTTPFTGLQPRYQQRKPAVSVTPSANTSTLAQTRPAPPTLASAAVRAQRQQRWLQNPASEHTHNLLSQAFGISPAQPQPRSPHKVQGRVRRARAQAPSSSSMNPGAVATLISQGDVPAYVDTTAAFVDINPHATADAPLAGRAVPLHLPHAKHDRAVPAPADALPALRLCLPEPVREQPRVEPAHSSPGPRVLTSTVAAPATGLLRHYKPPAENTNADALPMLMPPRAHGPTLFDPHIPPPGAAAMNGTRTGLNATPFTSEQARATAVAAYIASAHGAHARVDAVEAAPAPLLLGGPSVPGYLGEITTAPPVHSNAEYAGTLEELLGTHALHRLAVRAGVVVREGPEWRAFRRACEASGGAVREVLRALELFCRAHDVRRAVLRGDRVVALARDSKAVGALANVAHAAVPVLYGGRVAQLLAQCFLESDADLAAVLLDPMHTRTAAVTHSTRPLPQGRGGLIAGQRVLYTGTITPLVRAAGLRVLSVLQMARCRRAYLQVRARQRAAVTVQRAWRRHRALRRTRALAAAAWEAKHERWASMCSQFEQSQGAPSRGPRLLVHLPSVTLPPAQLARTARLHAQQSTGLARLADLLDPDVELVYLAPAPLAPSVKRFWFRLLCVAAQQRYGDALPAALTPEGITARLTVLSPDPDLGLVDVFVPDTHPPVSVRVCVYPPSLPLAARVLYSPRLLSRIRALVHSRNAVLVPGTVGAEDLRLAVELNLPLTCATAPAVLSGALQRAMTRAGARDLFRQAGLVQAVLDPAELSENERDVSSGTAFNVPSLCRTLARLIIAQPDTAEWVVRLEGERGGRGVLVVRAGELGSVVHIRTERVQHRHRWRLRETRLSARERVANELRVCLSSAAHEGRDVIVPGQTQPTSLSSFSQGVAEVVADHAKLSHPTPPQPSSPALFLAAPAYWGSITAYLRALSAQGAVVEPVPAHVLGVPSAHIHIGIDGQIDVSTTSDALFSSPFVPAGLIVPSTAPSALLHSACRALARTLRAEGIRGHITARFLLCSSIAPSSRSNAGLAVCGMAVLDRVPLSSLSLLAVSLRIGYSDAHAATQLLSLVTNALYTSSSQATAASNTLPFTAPTASYWHRLAPHLPAHKDWPLFLAPRPSQLTKNHTHAAARFAVYLPLVSLSALANLTDQALFANARTSDLTFDMASGNGALFLLIDSLTCGALSAMSTGETPTQALATAARMLAFLNKQVAGSTVAPESELVRSLYTMIEQLSVRDSPTSNQLV